MYDGRPQELEEYTRKLFHRLPAQAATRVKDRMFPHTYEHNAERKLPPPPGRNLTIFLTSIVIVFVLTLGALQYAWRLAIKDIRVKSQDWKEVWFDDNASAEASTATADQ